MIARLGNVIYWATLLVFFGCAFNAAYKFHYDRISYESWKQSVQWQQIGQQPDWHNYRTIEEYGNDLVSWAKKAGVAEMVSHSNLSWEEYQKRETENNHGQDLLILVAGIVTVIFGKTLQYILGGQWGFFKFIKNIESRGLL